MGTEWEPQFTGKAPGPPGFHPSGGTKVWISAILLELLICTEEGFALCLNPAADYGTRKCCVMLTTDMFVDLS
ncbi:unnamed protein product [Arctogadus glacialis]